MSRALEFAIKSMLTPRRSTSRKPTKHSIARSIELETIALILLFVHPAKVSFISVDNR